MTLGNRVPIVVITFDWSYALYVPSARTLSCGLTADGIALTKPRKKYLNGVHGSYR
jgi:hypothetical protein